MTEKSKSTENETLSELFPDVSTDEDSRAFARELTNAVVSTILCARKILPSSEFESKSYGGMTLRILKREIGHAGTERIKAWLTEAFDALENKYLKTMELEVSDADSNLCLEVYALTVEYYSGAERVSVAKDGEKMFVRDSTSNDVQFQTVRLLQMCCDMAKYCRDLPRRISLRMWLSYRGCTPRDYRPTWHKMCRPARRIFVGDARALELGIVDAAHRVVVEFVNFTCLGDGNDSPKANPGNPASIESEAGPRAVERVVDEESQSNSQSTCEGSQSDSVRCPCQSRRKTSVMYQCSDCGYWAHAECFGISLWRIIPTLTVFQCQICFKLDPNPTCHDKLMTDLTSAADQQKLAVHRRLLGFCRSTDKSVATARKLEKVSGLVCRPELLSAIVREMTEARVILQKTSDTFAINKDAASKEVSKYFYLALSASENAGAEERSKRKFSGRFQRGGGGGERKASPSKKKKRGFAKTETPSRIMPERIAKKPWISYSLPYSW